MSERMERISSGADYPGGAKGGGDELANEWEDSWSVGVVGISRFLLTHGVICMQACVRYSARFQPCNHCEALRHLSTTFACRIWIYSDL